MAAILGGHFDSGIISQSKRNMASVPQMMLSLMILSATEFTHSVMRYTQICKTVVGHQSVFHTSSEFKITCNFRLAERNV